jgi:hypothetical protein
MNRTLLSMLIGMLFRPHYVVEGDGTGDTGDKGDKGGTGDVTPPAVKPEDARAQLTEFGHSADALKGMKDEDVIKLHGTATGATKKAIEAAQKAWTEAQSKNAPTGDVKLELPKDKDIGLTAEDVASIATLAKEKKLSQEAAALIMEREAATVARVMERQTQNLVKLRDTWQETVKADPELGGEKLATTQRVAALFIDKFMPNSKDKDGKEVVHPLRKMLRESGYGDHPEVVRLFATVGKLMDEGKGPGTGGAPGGAKKTAEEILYGSPQS